VGGVLAANPLSGLAGGGAGRSADSGGGLTGVALGLTLAQVLVKVLTGVFDPAPEGLILPWNYLLLAVVVATIAVVLLMRLIVRQRVAEVLRDI